MKKQHLLCFIFFISIQSFAQDPRLFENIWHLVYFTNNDNINHVLPENPEVDYVGLTFYPEGYFSTNVCTAGGASIQFGNPGSDSYTVTQEEPFLGWDCTVPMPEFQFNYFSFICTLGNWTYQITEDGQVRTLIVTFSENKFGVYTSQILSTDFFQDSFLKIYPNPANSNLNIESDFGNINSIEIYDYLGKIVIQNNLSARYIELNIQSLSSGIYFIKIISDNKNIIKKFIKN